MAQTQHHAKRGPNPRDPGGRSITFRLTLPNYEGLNELALEQDRSMNYVVNAIVEATLAQRARAAAKPAKGRTAAA